MGDNVVDLTTIETQDSEEDLVCLSPSPIVQPGMAPAQSSGLTSQPAIPSLPAFASADWEPFVSLSQSSSQSPQQDAAPVNLDDTLPLLPMPLATTQGPIFSLSTTHAPLTAPATSLSPPAAPQTRLSSHPLAQSQDNSVTIVKKTSQTTSIAAEILELSDDDDDDDRDYNPVACTDMSSNKNTLAANDDDGAGAGAGAGANGDDDFDRVSVGSSCSSDSSGFIRLPPTRSQSQSAYHANSAHTELVDDHFPIQSSEPVRKVGSVTMPASILAPSRHLPSPYLPSPSSSPSLSPKPPPQSPAPFPYPSPATLTTAGRSSSSFSQSSSSSIAVSQPSPYPPPLSQSSSISSPPLPSKRRRLTPEEKARREDEKAKKKEEKQREKELAKEARQQAKLGPKAANDRGRQLPRRVVGRTAVDAIKCFVRCETIFVNSFEVLH
jgi:hypothetical protein